MNPLHTHVSMLDPLQTFARWRKDCAQALEQWLAWLQEQDLCPADETAQLVELIDKLKDEHFTVAIVAELSRGKSELINALLFTQLGRRIVPSGAGRTTMCPTEFYCDLSSAPFIELLPIETRNGSESITELRRNFSHWVRFPLYTNDADALANDLLRVGQTQTVQFEEAQRLGLIDDNDAYGDVVDIPRWRHARVNLHHPLLATGLTVIDTPGLNALGNEPELTYAVLPTADAVLFILAADVGVTRSDKQAWTAHLGHIPNETKWVVLNKIDGMWDDLKSNLEVRTEISRQADQCAKALAIPTSQVFPLSAQKGLYARIQNDAELLVKSRLETLEAALTHGLLDGRKSQLIEHAQQVFMELFQQAQSSIQASLSQAQTQLEELENLANSTIDEKTLQQQFLAEREHFIDEGKHILILRKEINAHTKKVFELLMPQAVDYCFSELLETCETGSFQTMEVALAQCLSNILDRLLQAKTHANAAVSVLRNARKVGAIKSTRPKKLALDNAILELERYRASVKLEPSVLPFLTLRHRKRLLRTVLALSDRIKALVEDSVKDAELWLYGLVTPLERTLRDRQQSVRKRTETLNRVGQAQSALSEHIGLLNSAIIEDTQRYELLLQKSKTVHAVLHPIEPTQAAPLTL